MNSAAIVFLLINVGGLFFLPRRWAVLPLLVGACYMTGGQGIEIGPFSFSVIRLLIAAGVLRAIMRGELLGIGLNWLDWMMLMWASWAIVSSLIRPDENVGLVFRLGLVYNTCGIYFLVRIFCQSFDDFVIIIAVCAILLVPVAVEMFSEKITGRNLFSVFGGVSKVAAVRQGNVRAQGPFSHPILAGTVGAVVLPLMVGLWYQSRKASLLGIGACIIMIFTCASSGPIFSALAGIGALFLWHLRQRMRLVRWIALFGYIGLDIVMKAPAYYLIARVDAVGGSTGWHRARLIEMAFAHLSEWWFAGTGYTRHWMPTGVSWSPDHADITNHYIKMGVYGGLPLMILFILILVIGFSYVGQVLQKNYEQLSNKSFMVWALGASLFANAATMISVSYFDQSFVFLYLKLAAIGSLKSLTFDVQSDGRRANGVDLKFIGRA